MRTSPQSGYYRIPIEKNGRLKFITKGRRDRRGSCIVAQKPREPLPPVDPYAPVQYRDAVQEAVGARFAEG